MDEIEKMTLELLTNKNQYNKYLSKEDPRKFREHQEYLEKIAKFKGKMLNLSKQFLENPEKSFNLEMDEMFSIFERGHNLKALTRLNGFLACWQTQ